MKKKQIILPNLRYENSPEVDSTIRVDLESQKGLLRNDDRDIVLDLSEQFQTERSNCKRYKFYGKMKMIFRNLYLGTSDYPFLEERLFLQSDGSDNCFAGYLPYNEFAFIRNDVDRESPVDLSLSSLDTFSGFDVSKSGTTYQHVEISAASGYSFNWNLYLSYVDSHDYEYPMKYTLTGTSISPLSFVSGDGIPFRVAETDSVYVLTSPVRHGMSRGEYIFIDEIPVPFYISSIGNTTYNSEYHVLTINKAEVGGYRLNGMVTGKRCTDKNDTSNSTSQYYVHNHIILTNTTDLLIDKVGFESPIWEDEKKMLYENSVGDNDVVVVKNRMESILFDHFDPFVLSGITNNLGYTPTDVYLSVVFRNGNGYFEYPPKLGYSFHFHDAWVDEHFDGSTSIESQIPSLPFNKGGLTGFTKGLPMSQYDRLTGAFIEYHPKEMKERVISEAFHRISANPNFFNHGQSDPNIYTGCSSTNMFGLYYQPHYRFKVRELSPYTEKSTTNTIYNLPENARYFPSEKVWRWRDLYDIGYVDPDGYGTDYPYMNDTHYVHKDINFYLRNEYVYTNKKDGILGFNSPNYGDTCEKSAADVATYITVNPTPSPTPSISPTPSVTPTSSVSPTPTPSITPSISVTPTPSITPSISITPTVTPTPSTSQC